MNLDHIVLSISREESLKYYEKLGLRKNLRFARTYDTVVFILC